MILDRYLLSFYKDALESLPYNSLLADTYIINSSNTFIDFKNFVRKSKDDFFRENIDNEIISKYGKQAVLVISSLIEKEALNEKDKYLIASVIFNRLKLKMKLQIDASVIYSITEGAYKFDRKLTYKDLKIQHPANTYVIKGIPSNMISYVGLETIKIVMKNPKSDFLFYFYNILENKHIYSKNYEEHKRKLNEYRKKK